MAAFAPFHPRTEEMRALRTQLLIRWYNPEQGRKSLVVASPERGEGRSYVAANLAVVFSQLGARTLLVDADLRTPRQHRDLRPARGASACRRCSSGRSGTHTATCPVPGMNRPVGAAGGPAAAQPAGAAVAPGVRRAHEGRCSPIYDVVIIDTPPAPHYADTQSVTFRAGDALVRHAQEPHAGRRHGGGVRELADTGARVVGTVINVF